MICINVPCITGNSVIFSTSNTVESYAKDKIVQPGASARFKHANQHFAEPPARFELYVEGRPVD